MFTIKKLIGFLTITLLFTFILSGTAECALLNNQNGQLTETQHNQGVAPHNQNGLPPNHQDGRITNMPLNRQNGKMTEMQIKQGTELSYSSQRVELYVKKDYLTKSEIEDIAKRIETGLSDIEKYFNTKFEDIYGSDKKITYYINGGKFVSHVQGGWNQRDDETPIPNVYLSYAKEKIAPYLHETVHIMNPRYGSLWIREGLAVYLNEKLKGYKSRLTDTDILSEAKNNLTKTYEEALNLVGKNGIPNELKENDEQQDAFYIFSGSFVNYIESKIGTETFMKIYADEDTKNAVLKYTNKSVDMWKYEWLDYLGAPQSLNPMPVPKQRSIVLQLNYPLLKADGITSEIDPGRGTVPCLVEDRVMIPIKVLIESMGGTTSWNESDKKVSIAARGKNIDLWINKNVININGKEKEIDVAPQVINERTMVPVRFVAESLNCNVSWDGENGKVIITFEE